MNNVVRFLNLSGNDVADDGGTNSGYALTVNKSLTSLDLSNNKVRVCMCVCVFVCVCVYWICSDCE